MSDRAIPDHILPSLYRFFWDVDPATVNPQASPDYVINRLLDKGNIEAARWVLAYFSRKSIIDVLKNGPSMIAISGAFWANYLNISMHDMPPMIPYVRVPSRLWKFD